MLSARAHCGPDVVGAAVGETPYIPAPEVVVVRVTAHGGVHDGQVLGWRGDRVYVSYRTVDGNHLAWVPAADVERN